jgi:hypothetical protein
MPGLAPEVCEHRNGLGRRGILIPVEYVFRKPTGSPVLTA